MRQFPQREVRRARIEIIPMIDVMMFLLAFFVLISMNVLPALGLKVALPSSASPEKVQEQKRITLTIDQGGDVLVDGKPTPVAQVAAALRSIAGNDKPSVIIAGDGHSNLQVLVDVLDQLKDAGLPAASIITKAK
ncbi:MULTISPECIES: ExbD/TolR family protein [Paraburkholderia]|uniref:Outer membrane transport energization protein ExbD n=1 Tax=Paraburkholderia phenazinium TaxID=60549 RepID=A0A1N6J086_9BURK|nr:biopolymer transporter ExbD [Paraburkholderia phenazinium]SIO37665.1 outer membrane transport energization protein ExbD [Paraburkholderia phenazinium]